MSRISILFAITLIISLVSLEEQDVNYRLYRGQMQFAVSMLNALAKQNPGKNLFFSSHSIYRTLLRAYIGSGGEIKESLKEILFLDWANDDIDITNAYKAEKIGRVARLSGDNIHFSSSDKFYVPKDVMIPRTIRDAFTFDEIKRMDFSDPTERRTDINAFVEEHTQGNIDQMLSADSVQNRKNVVLVNAVLFKGFLKNRFDARTVRLQDFYGASEQLVEMMSAVHILKHGVLVKENTAFLELPYEGDQEAISMFIYLPLDEKPNAIDNFLSIFSHATIQQAMFSKNYKLIDILMPKIAFKSELHLKDALEDMGLRRFFDSNFFGDIIHKTFAEINEKGLFADVGVSTADEGSRGNVDSVSIATKFHCNRPFVFTINDRVTQEILFSGVYRGPE